MTCPRLRRRPAGAWSVLVDPALAGCLWTVALMPADPLVHQSLTAEDCPGDRNGPRSPGTGSGNWLQSDQRPRQRGVEPAPVAIGGLVDRLGLEAHVAQQVRADPGQLDDGTPETDAFNRRVGALPQCCKGRCAVG